MKSSHCLGLLLFLWRVFQQAAVLNQNENVFAPAFKVLRNGTSVNKATIFGLVAHMLCLSLYMHTYFCSMFWCKKSTQMVARVEGAELCLAFGFLRILLHETMQAECKLHLFHCNFSIARVSSHIVLTTRPPTLQKCKDSHNHAACGNWEKSRRALRCALHRSASSLKPCVGVYFVRPCFFTHASCILQASTTHVYLQVDNARMLLS